jgi:erythritol transport system ATP-binding protein
MALKGVTFRVHRGKVNVLIGENGAGKSTLMRILAGAETPTSGQILLEGNPILLRSTRDAAGHRIAMVHQELNLLPNLDVSENIFAGRELAGRFGFIRRRQQDEISGEALRRLNALMSVRDLTGALALGRQQIVELARSIAFEASVLILDEPTSALSRSEAETLFKVISDLKRQGVSIVYISHRLDELLLLGDHFTVLRDGKVVGETSRGQIDRRWIVERMTGRPVQTGGDPGEEQAGQEVLAVDGLNLAIAWPSGGTRSLLKDVSFSARSGQILGIYGLLGSGRTELLETLAGLRAGHTGQISVRGKRVRLDSPVRAAREGIALVPEDRQRDGLIPSLSIRENISVASLGRLTNGIFVSRTKELHEINRLAGELSLKTRDLDLPVTSLSGGNQQKALLARCMMQSPSILLLDEPTRGIDVGARQDLYRILRRLAQQGMCIIFTSSEIEEIHSLAESILVLCRGEISARSGSRASSEEQLFSAASGHLYMGAQA